MTHEDVKADTDGRMSGEPSSERRGGMRVARVRLAKVFDPVLERYYAGRTEQVGSGGVRVGMSAGALLRPGSAVEVYISDDDSDPLVSRSQMRPARVVWVDRSARAGAGRMFVGLQYAAATAARMSAA